MRNDYTLTGQDDFSFSFRHFSKILSRVYVSAGKRVFDVLFSIAVLLVLVPFVFPIIAILIMLESKGPIFFIQKRTGLRGETFKCMKFRTMVVNDVANRQSAQKNDPRITKFGALMRKTNLDELPQFINVLMGDMSVVGPRPHMLRHTIEFREIVDDYDKRLDVKPGITGVAQINGFRGLIDCPYKLQKRVQYDLYYVDNVSFGIDVKCVVMTVINLILGEENAF